MLLNNWKQSSLIGTKSSNIIGALGEIIAWDALRQSGIWSYKIGSWDFFPKGYPHWADESNEENPFLTKEQADFVRNKVRNNIIEFDFVGVKWKAGKRPFFNKSVEAVHEAYLIEVKTGRSSTIQHYARNPTKAFSPENVEEAKRLGFRVLLVVVELLHNWSYRIRSVPI
jgi:hypothetical protein